MHMILERLADASFCPLVTAAFWVDGGRGDGGGAGQTCPWCSNTSWNQELAGGAEAGERDQVKTVAEGTTEGGAVVMMAGGGGHGASGERR